MKVNFSNGGTTNECVLLDLNDLSLHKPIHPEFSRNGSLGILSEEEGYIYRYKKTDMDWQ